MVGWLIKRLAKRYLTEENVRNGLTATAIGVKEYFSSATNRKVCLDAVSEFASHLAIELVKVSIEADTANDKAT